MKKITIFIAYLGFALLAHGQMPSVSTKPAQTLNVAIFLYPGVGLGDLSGPLDVFKKASAMTNGQYHVYTIALNPGMIATANNGLHIQPDYIVPQMPRPDILVIPGGSIGLLDSMTRDMNVTGFIRSYSDSVQVLLSVCTAAYIVAKAGVLDNKPATTHWYQADDLQTLFPAVKIVRDVRFVDDGKVMTASGVVCGIDAALHLVERFSGQRTEKFIEGAIQYVMHEQEKWPEPIEGMKFDREKRKKMGMLAQ